MEMLSRHRPSAREKLCLDTGGLWTCAGRSNCFCACSPLPTNLPAGLCSLSTTRTCKMPRWKLGYAEAVFSGIKDGVNATSRQEPYPRLVLQDEDCSLCCLK